MFDKHFQQTFSPSMFNTHIFRQTCSTANVSTHFRHTFSTNIVNERFRQLISTNLFDKHFRYTFPPNCGVVGVGVQTIICHMIIMFFSNKRSFWVMVPPKSASPNIPQPSGPSVSFSISGNVIASSESASSGGVRVGYELSCCPSTDRSAMRAGTTGLDTSSVHTHPPTLPTFRFAPLLTSSSS